MKRDEQARPLKPPTSVPEQIELLRSRGMAVDDELASQWLEAVLYYRLSAYWYPLRRVDT
ncbi:MAG: Abi family protein, partial [Actinomyces graevenitzii]|nr:Abi family protein [Actinomyces graevenitzii]